MKKSIFITLIFCISYCIPIYSQQAKGTVQIETSAKINEVVAKKKQYNRNLKTYKGYKIQLFYGSEKGAYELKDKFTLAFPDIPTKISFSSPNWKVQAGKFRTRLEADNALVEIKKDFAGSTVVAADIEIEK